MSTRKVKKVYSFRINDDVIDLIKDLIERDPVAFRSVSSVVEAAIHNFVTLNKTQQKEALREYLTKDL